MARMASVVPWPSYWGYTSGVRISVFVRRLSFLGCGDEKKCIIASVVC